MKRPDLDTLACVNPECQQFRLAGQDNLTVRKVYGQDRIRLLRCRTCGEEFSEWRGTALFNTKVAEERAEFLINHVDEGCGVRATARLVHVAKDPVARWLRRAGRHAEWFHDQRVRDVTPRAARHNGTSRLRNQRKVRKTLAFSKVPWYHRWMSWLSVGLDSFCRGHSRLKSTQGAHVQHRSPAMAAKFTDHIGTVREWLLCPVLGEQG